MTLAHLLLTEGGTQQVTRCKHKHNDNRGKISDARESAVTLCCVAFFIHLPPPWCVYCVCGAQVCSPGQAVPGARAGSGQGWWRGRAQSWRRHGSGDTDSDTQGESGQRGDTETRENIINSDICGENSREYCRVWQWPGEDHIQWEIWGAGVCLQVVSLGVITVSRANIENQHLLDRLLLICEIVAWTSDNCGQIWRGSLWWEVY